MNKTISISASTSYTYLPTASVSSRGATSHATVYRYVLSKGDISTRVVNSVEEGYPILIALNISPANFTQTVVDVLNGDRVTIYNRTVSSTNIISFIENALIFSEVFHGEIQMNLTIYTGINSAGNFANNAYTKNVSMTYSSGNISSDSSFSLDNIHTNNVYGFISNIEVLSINGVDLS